MSTTRYPMINYDKCTACAECIGVCPAGVFSQDGEYPFVTSPTACRADCTACVGACTVQAITYYGEDDGDALSCCLFSD